MRDLAGRVAILTGGSRGLGPVIGSALAKRGVHLALASRSKAELEITARELASRGVRTIAVPADITVAEHRTELLRRAEAELGPVDLLVNNAGVQETAHFARQSPDTIARILETNLTAPLLLSQLVLQRMLERRRGHIVTVSSVSGKRGAAFQAAYSASKAGLVEWTSALRAELEGTGVGISVVCPGLIGRVGMWARHGKKVPWFARESSPEDVAEAVVDAVERDLHEVIVNPLPLRPLVALKAISPSAANAVIAALGLVDIAREVADEASMDGV